MMTQGTRTKNANKTYLKGKTQDKTGSEIYQGHVIVIAPDKHNWKR